MNRFNAATKRRIKSGEELRLSDAMPNFEKWFPYAFYPVDGPFQHMLLPLTKHYDRPGGPRWCNPSEHLDHAMVFATDPREFTGCWIGDVTGRYLYLWGTGQDELADVGARLQRLVAHPWFFFGDSPPAMFAAPRRPLQ